MLRELAFGGGKILTRDRDVSGGLQLLQNLPLLQRLRSHVEADVTACERRGEVEAALGRPVHEAAQHLQKKGAWDD
jgi:hypothetical protein